MLLLMKHLKSMPMHTFSAIRAFFVVFENYNNDYCYGCNATEILWLDFTLGLIFFCFNLINHSNITMPKDKVKEQKHKNITFFTK